MNSKINIIVWLLFTGMISKADAGLIDDLISRLQTQKTAIKHDVQDLKIVQEMTAFQGVAAGMVYQYIVYKKGEKIRMDMSLQAQENKTGQEPAGQDMSSQMSGMNITVIYDGGKMWMNLPMMGWQEYEESAKEVQDYRRQQMDWAGFVTQNTKIIGTEKVKGVNCLALDVSAEEGAPYQRIWIDEKRLVIIKARTEGADGVLLDSYYSEYKKVTGKMLYPYLVDVFAGEELVSRVAVKEISYNTGLDDRIFIPSEVSGSEEPLTDDEKAAGALIMAAADTTREVPEISSCCLVWPFQLPSIIAFLTDLFGDAAANID